MLEQLPEWLRHSTVGKALIAERRKEVQADRRRLVDQRSGLERQRDAPLKSLDQEIATARARCDKAQAELNAASLAWRAAVATRTTHLHTVQVQISAIDRQLRQSADARIDDTWHRLNARWDAIRPTALQYVDEVTGEISMNTGKPITRMRSNRAGVDIVVDALNRIRQQLEQLKIGAPDDLDAALSAIEASVPWNALEKLDPIAA